MGYYKIYLGLGGNIGDVFTTISKALAALEAIDHTKILHLSSPYKTPPWGNVQQPPFINACALVQTTTPPESFLELCLDIERKLHRERREKWGPRTIDIDLLTLENDFKFHSSNLILPHPHMLQRAFVLIPLNEIAPDLIVLGKKIRYWTKTQEKNIENEEIQRLSLPESWKNFQNKHIKG